MELGFLKLIPNSFGEASGLHIGATERVLYDWSLSWYFSSQLIQIKRVIKVTYPSPPLFLETFSLSTKIEVFLHIMLRLTGLLVVVPSELTAWHSYSPRDIRPTFCRTKLWVLITIPLSWFCINCFPWGRNNTQLLLLPVCFIKLSNFSSIHTLCNHISLCGIGLDLTSHSKYTSFPVLRLSGSKDFPRRRETWGLSMNKLKNYNRDWIISL